MSLSGPALFEAVLRGPPADLASLLAALKTHVKKDNVDLRLVPKYFEALSVALDNRDVHLQLVAFSVVCHLVKRVSIQDASSRVLASQAYLVLPILIPRLADAKPAVKLAARRALEAYWLSSPQSVEAALAETGLAHRSGFVVNEVVVWLNHILTVVNPHFSLAPFLAPLAAVLAKCAHDAKLVTNIRVLFDNYYDQRANRIHKFELLRILEKHAVDPLLRAAIMGTDAVISGVPESGTRSDATLPPPPSNEPLREDGPAPPDAAVPAKAPSTELDALLSALKGYSYDESIEPLDISGPAELADIVSAMSPAFNNKETDRNWMLREKNITKLRALVRGNALVQFRLDLLQAIKDVHEGICKSLSSLRTTLSVHTCQLLKDMAILLGADIDHVADLFFPTLLKLCATTKQMATSNANVATCAILANGSLGPKALLRILHSANEKSVNTKSYALLWLKIYILRCPPGSSDSAHETIGRILQKLLPDPNLQVRQAAKEAYWVYNTHAAESAQRLLSRLDSSTKKALERSRTPTAHPRFSKPSLLRPRSSLRETVKSKEVARSQSLSHSSSKHSLNLHTQPRKPSNLLDTRAVLAGAPRPQDATFNAIEREAKVPAVRVLPKIEKSGLNDTRSPRDHEPHYAKSTFAQPSASSGPSIDSSFTSSKTSVKPSNTSNAFHLASIFTQQKDPILTFLASSQPSLIHEGVNLLRFAIIGNEELPDELGVVLRKVTICNPIALKSLFNGDEIFIKKLTQLLPAEDFLRIWSILASPSERAYGLILTYLATEDLYKSVETLLSYILDLDSASDDKILVMQIIKFKKTMLGTLFEFMAYATSHIPITDLNFAKLTVSLFDLVPIVHQTQQVGPYQVLLKNLYYINTSLFASQLLLIAKSNKREIEHLVGIDNVLEYKQIDSTMFNMTELTQIAPGKNLEVLSPLKQPSDFTMLIPSNKSMADGPVAFLPEDQKARSPLQNTENLDETEDDEICLETPPKMKEISDDDVVMDDIPLAEESGCKPSAQDLKDTTLGIKVPQEIVQIDDEFKASSHSSPSPLLAMIEDFAQVQLSNSANSIQTFVEKFDPLQGMSGRNKQISIFEDATSGSPQKVKEYCFTDLNWFNFLMASLFLDPDFSKFNEFSVSEFRSLCAELGTCVINRANLTILLKYMQNTESREFLIFLRSEGYQLVEQSLWQQLSNPTRDFEQWLIVMKQLLVIRHKVDLHRLWDAVIAISIEGQPGPIQYAAGEVYDECLTGMYPSALLLDTVTNSLISGVADTNAIRFCAESLLKIVSAQTLALVVNEALLLIVDTAVQDLVFHDVTIIRKTALEIYGVLLRVTRMKGVERACEKSNSEVMEEILGRKTKTQRKLIEYFGQ